VETVESQQAVRMSSKIGNRRYPHSTALGKVLLSDLPEREMLRLLKAKGMPKFTQATIVRKHDLIVELERVRTQGFALDSMENEPDGRCIAAPVMDSGRKVVAALSISGPLPRMTLPRAKSMLRDLTHICRAIAAAAG
jgi:IclR family transcriptional regulator, KDG regulon repressor